MIYGEEIIEEVRSRNDIVDLISTYVPLKKKAEINRCITALAAEPEVMFLHF